MSQVGPFGLLTECVLLKGALREVGHAERVEVRNEADARDLVEKDRQARAADKRELYYLILFPRGGPGTFPTKAQRAQYRDWFKDVALGWDIPGVDTVPGGMP